ncbi:2-aminobenzoate-CoA ligase, partial [Streptomyces sp. Ru73]|uniref:AMP-binding protein n=1 Tax=Streptomyces sp. Ru73 TaxID=2080748 RepID=UPI000D4A1655
MEMQPSAHTDTFARDHLPPPAQWPHLTGLPCPPRLNCGTELLDGSLHRFGADRPAVRHGDGTVWTYGELRAHVNRLAHVLTDDLGVLPGERVLLRGPTSPELAACWLAVMKAGAIAVTVPAAQRAHELATLCGIARVRHAVCDVRSVDDLAKAGIPGLAVT